MAKRPANSEAADTDTADVTVTDGADLVADAGQETLGSPDNAGDANPPADDTVVELDLVEGEATQEQIDAAIQKAIQDRAAATAQPEPMTAAEVYEITNNGGSIPSGWSFDARHPDGYFRTT